MGSDPEDRDKSLSARDPVPLSVERLKHALVTMFGTQAPEEDAEPAADESCTPENEVGVDPTDADDACPISPTTILEAMLFVGHPENKPLASQEAATQMRGVQPAEIDELVAELNELYEETEAPYEIIGQGEGYRLVLRESFARIREKFYGRLREARLSRSAVEVLSIVAYRQPVTLDQINQLRGSPSGSILSQLVRRELVRLERLPDRPRWPLYYSTDRFLRLFGLSGLEDLPQCEDPLQEPS